MLKNSLTLARTHGAKLAAGAGALVVSGMAAAQDAQTASQQIQATVSSAMSDGASIATAVVLGLFAIWAIKLLWRGK